MVAHASATVDAILKASARLAAHGASAAASRRAEAPHSRGSGLNASAISSSQNRMWLQHRPQRTTRRTADGSRTAQIASHGRLTACRSRLMRYPARADDRRASLFLRRGALCILACVVHGILCASCRFPYLQCASYVDHSLSKDRILLHKIHTIENRRENVFWSSNG